MAENEIAVVHHVDAAFVGQRLRFQLGRDRASIEALERAVGSVSAAWGRFRTGDWTMHDIRSILLLAWPKSFGPTDALSSLLPRQHRTAGLTLGSAEMEIDQAISARPLATYATLAGAILTAAFIGLPEADAVFEDGDRAVAAQNGAAS